MKKSLYDLVGVPPVAPREMIGMACKRRIAKLEAAGTDEAKVEIYAIREAWSILGDEKLRAGYDASLAAEKPGAPTAVDPLAARISPEVVATIDDHDQPRITDFPLSALHSPLPKRPRENRKGRAASAGDTPHPPAAPQTRP